jgi:hypothetical protein
MSRNNRTTRDILSDAQETIATTEYGFQDLKMSHPQRKLPGLRNLVVFGRAVTNVLQNLRSTETDFDRWYEKYETEMRLDPLMKYFHDLRSEILKNGSLRVSTQIYIRRLKVPQDMSRFGPPPPNAKAFFVGDHLGGTGWEIQLPDGSLERYYVDLPSDIGSVSLHFPEPPQHHLGQEIADRSIEALSRLYLDYLHRLLTKAKARFG